MNLRPLGPSGLSVAPVIPGGTVLACTADPAAGFPVLDAAVDAGLDAIDTADADSRGAPGHSGGDSETISGRWRGARPGVRKRIGPLTGVGSDMGLAPRGAPARGCSARWIDQAVEGSLRRLGDETIDHCFACFSHRPDDDRPQAEPLTAYDRPIRTGKIRSTGASNLPAARLQAALVTADREGLPRDGSIQPDRNLIDRARLAGGLLDVCRARGLGGDPRLRPGSGSRSGRSCGPADTAAQVAELAATARLGRAEEDLDALDAASA